MTDKPQAVEPLSCPFCGSTPSWISKSMAFGTGASGQEPPMRALGCVMPLCAVMPHTAWQETMEYRSPGYFAVSYDKQAVAAWNTREAS